ncbi:hypothetical protein CIG19_01250 [Enterobacterales bacterium CwR94]|nr:hypothetical protein CIG19_01250 [Enterobacterales bacterium CwR94]
MHKYYIALFFIFYLSACSNRVVFSPVDLPDAYINRDYTVPVTITGGHGPVVDLTYDIFPPDAGLQLLYEEKSYYTTYIYNSFMIVGKPKRAGVIKINIKGGIVASAGKMFEKNYEINVME